jgi:hypothetical protein
MSPYVIAPDVPEGMTLGQWRTRKLRDPRPGEIRRLGTERNPLRRMRLRHAGRINDKAGAPA